MRSIILFVITICIVSCSKKTADTPLATVPERLDIEETSVALKVGESFSFTLVYYNDMGIEAGLPGSIAWESSNTAVATVTPSGVVTSISEGIATLYAKYQDAVDSVVVNVVADDLSIATITINPNPGAVLINQMITFSAVAKNIIGDIIPGVVFSWNISEPLIASINENGEAVANTYGTTTVRAMADGVSSAPVELQVIRTGNFTGMSSKGSAVLRITGGILKLETSSDFSVSTAPPDLRIYLTNNKSNITGGVEVASLTQRSGAQSWNVISGVSITDYRYALVWCKQFGGSYGVADLGE